MAEPRVQTLALVGSYVPRQCGIATFTKDMRDGLAAEGQLQPSVLALDDVEEGYRYPEEVRFEIRANDLHDYQLAADLLNINQIDVVLVQHEYGLYGARAGENILTLVRNTRMPVLTTLHTVLDKPNREQAAVMSELVEESDGLVVMSRRGGRVLCEAYGVPEQKVHVIPHGIPDVPFTDPSFFRDRFGLQGKRVLLTFGLLSRGKGIETAIRALPGIVERHPEVMYVVLGAIHPHVLKREGNSYLTLLSTLAEKLGVQDHVVFRNRYVTLEELCAYLGAADIYVTPYAGREQTTSGTLAYAMGAGKAVISTPFWHAEEMLADERGLLFPFGDHAALARAVTGLLDDPISLDAMRKRAYLHCRSMVWKKVAAAYLRLAGEVLQGRLASPRSVSVYGARREPALALPDIKLDHLRALTDDTGVLQHAIYTVPNRAHGYCTDDNARALVVAMMHWDQTEDESILPLMSKYLSFLHYAYDAEAGRFRNMLDYDRHWRAADESSDDTLGRALWGLGLAVAFAPVEGVLALASRLFSSALVRAEQLQSPRAGAFALVGIHAYLRRFSGDSYVRRVRENLARRLFDRFRDQARPDWPWCEPAVTYANGKLPHALLLSGQWLPDPALVEQGLTSLRWLLERQTDERGRLSLIGNRGWMSIDGARALFDQQPIDAMALLEACAEAYRCTQESFWLRKTHWCLEWFLGNNVTDSMLYDSSTGGCRDGLHADGPNLNEGAESTLAWLISLLAVNRLRRETETGIAERAEPLRQG